ncbi:MAG: hypothetical protein PHF58_13170 [Methylotenera sp.]|nr:hypothetical protein [Methylotenera sp.]
MLKKIINNPTAILAMAYIAGQGSVFIAQLAYRLTGHHDIVGILVLIVSFFSFAYQFADFGNQTIVLRKIRNNQNEELNKYIVSRSILAITITAAFCVYLINVTQVELKIFVLVLPVLSFIFGLSRIGVIEHSGNYKMMALLQAMPWVALALGSMVFCFDRASSYNIYILAIFISAISYIILTYLASKTNTLEFAPPSSTTLNEAFSVIAGPIAAQIWGRFVLVYVASNAGLNALGILGLIKYGQVAISLGISFYLRPRWNKIVSIAMRDGEFSTYPSFRKLILQSLIASLLGPALWVILNLLAYTNMISSEFGEWSLVLLVIPFWTSALFSVLYSQTFRSPKSVVFQDYIGLIFNISIFFLMQDYGLVIAVTASEIGHSLVKIVSTITAIKLANRKME